MILIMITEMLITIQKVMTVTVAIIIKVLVSPKEKYV